MDIATGGYRVQGPGSEGSEGIENHIEVAIRFN